MRAFIAVELPAEIEAALTGLQRAVPAGRPVPPDNLHLTLAFLGDQDEPVLAELHGELEQLRAGRFDLAISGLGQFGDRLPKLLFAAVDHDPALMALHAQVLGAVRRAGIALSRRRLRPHITLARFGRAPGPGEAADLARFVAENAGFSVPALPVEAFGLFRSTLRPKGALHEELARYPLT